MICLQFLQFILFELDVAIVKLCVLCGVYCNEKRCIESAFRSTVRFLGKNSAHVGFLQWSFASGRASDWCKGRRECTECE